MKCKFVLQLICCAALLAGGVSVFAAEPAPVRGLVAVGHDSRIDLRWMASADKDIAGYRVYRASEESGPFRQISPDRHQPTVYSDFLGANDQWFYYRVTAIGRDRSRSAPSDVRLARSRKMSDEQLLTSVQEATFRYFWDWGHPVSGMARERHPARGDGVAVGGTGFGLMAIVVGVERKFISRFEAAWRVRKILTFLEEKAQRYHGAWTHWMNGETGRTMRFSKYDDGGDLVETSFLIQGILTARQYFNGANTVEADIRKRATRLWRGVEWDWYLRKPDKKGLVWHWSPKYGFKKNLRIGGRFNECMITYLLAIASPTHPIPASCYHTGWVRNPARYVNGEKYYGYTQPIGLGLGGPLFFTHYSYLGFDPRGKRDKYCNYFVNNRNTTLIHRAYCIDNPMKHKGYGANVWGLTASVTPDGYSASAPGRHDTGTIAPTACISAMPYAPKESLAAMKHLYHVYGKKLWGPFGFRDAFNPGRDWVARGYLSIDQGPIVVMIENHRTGVPWKLFMSNPEIAPALKATGFKPAMDTPVKKHLE
ncbi:MAG: glucoamylase family protein [Phycisphaerae bacterium]|nr:glucoamylase family protein [Phycisphaerae bacterium]